MVKLKTLTISSFCFWKLSRGLNFCMQRTNIRHNFIEVAQYRAKPFAPEFLAKHQLNNSSNYTFKLENKYERAQAYHNFGPCHSKIISHAQYLSST